MPNVFEQFKALLPQAPLQVGTVSAVANGVATVDLPGGGQIRARGSPAVGSRVFVRDGLIEAVAPNLPLEIIEV